MIIVPRKPCHALYSAADKKEECVSTLAPTEKLELELA